MRTRNRFLPVLLLVLAASTVAAVAAPLAHAYMRPPVQAVTIDSGDPDDPVPACSSTVPPPSGEPVRPMDRPSWTRAPRVSALDTDSEALATLHKGEWQLRGILFHFLFLSPILR